MSQEATKKRKLDDLTAKPVVEEDLLTDESDYTDDDDEYDSSFIDDEELSDEDESDDLEDEPVVTFQIKDDQKDVHVVYLPPYCTLHQAVQIVKNEVPADKRLKGLYKFAKQK